MKYNVKGKYTLSNYIIKDNILFYQSSKKDKKIEAFAFVSIETGEYLLIIKVFNALLEKRIINYYSIQIDISKKIQKDNLEIILNFEDYNQNTIYSRFSNVQTELNNLNLPHHFLENKDLENDFFNRIIQKLNSNIYCVFENKSIIIKEITKDGQSKSKESKTNEILAYLNLYDIKFAQNQNYESFINTFSDLLNSLNVSGLLILQFKANYQNKIEFSLNFLKISCNKNALKCEIEHEINEFYKYNILNKVKTKQFNLLRLVWRLPASEISYLYEYYSNIFNFEKQYEFEDFSKFSFQIEQNLLKNNIKFQRISDNLLFIEDNYLLYYSNRLNLDQLSLIISKYYPKYIIYILALGDNEYNQIIQLDNIVNLKGINVLDKKRFLDFDINQLKNS